MSRKNRKKGLMHNYFIGQEGYDQPHFYKNNEVMRVKKGWDTGDAPKVCTNCDWHTKETRQKIVVTFETWKALTSICASVKVEWQALLKGSIDAEGVVNINGYLIPKQEVGPTHVRNLDIIDDTFIRDNGIIAGVHSHADMNCFFSSVDHEHTNMSLIRHNIVINNKSEYKALSRVDLPCGMVKFVEGTIYTVGEPEVTVVGLDNIKKTTFGFFAKDNVVETVSAPLSNGKPYNSIPGGRRWCPICDLTAEEDSGESCTCWTKGIRPMLPDFTLENYEVEHGMNYELKPELRMKYTGALTQQTSYPYYD